VAVLGELGLEGAIRPVRGALPVALAARAAGLDALVLPRENLAEAGGVAGIRVLGAGTPAEGAELLDAHAERPEAEGACGAGGSGRPAPSARPPPRSPAGGCAAGGRVPDRGR